MIGLDTSFLVALSVREHPAHSECQQIFDAEILGNPGSMALTPQVLAEFCHVVTDPRRFEHPLQMADALDLSEQLWSAQECRQIPIDGEVGTLFLTWMHAHRLGRNRLLDTLIAAAYHRAGVTRLATSDWRDFERYGVFEIVRVA